MLMLVNAMEIALVKTHLCDVETNWVPYQNLPGPCLIIIIPGTP